MDAVTYPDSRVADTLEQNFVPVKLTVAEGNRPTEEAMDRYNVVWTPTMIVLDETGKEVRRSVGWLPPDEMVAELHMGLGAYYLVKKQYDRAFDCFQRVVREAQNSRQVPEAIYWSGMARYEKDHDPSGLMEYWHELRDRFPDSEWWRKASFIDKG